MCSVLNDHVTGDDYSVNRKLRVFAVSKNYCFTYKTFKEVAVTVRHWN